MNFALLAKYLPAVGLVGLAVYHLSTGDAAGAEAAVLKAISAAVNPPPPAAPATN